MKKNLICILIIFTILAGMFVLSACYPKTNEENSGGNNNNTAEPVLISDYTLAQNFAITMQLTDTSISNPGDPWYYKTAKIENDWQLIEYDRDLEDRTKQATHYFEYVSENNYTHYIYNYDLSSWTQTKTGLTFEDMMKVSINNFIFLYEKPTNPSTVITETATTYDTNSTSIETLINAKMYTYKDYFDIEIIVDSVFTDICLYKKEMDNSLIVNTYRAYDYSTDVDNWGNGYMTGKNYKSKP